ncbi:MAG: CPBP family intramembrane glutamic endopeptidase [Akkermansiaceae bacterium]
MDRGAAADSGKVWLYATASVGLGAWMGPLVYNAGKALAEVSAGRHLNDPLDWLARLCREADFPQFFLASLVLAAGLLALPFIAWLGGGYRRDAAESGLRLRPNPRGPRQAATGFLGVALLFLLSAGLWLLTPALEWRPAGANLPFLVASALVVAVGWAFLQEILFRGIALGIFLRALRPAVALGLSATLFALVHGLNPPPGMTVADPDAGGTGFEMLGKIVTRFSDPRVVLSHLAPLLALGGVLAYARWRTASLWLPTGIHAGLLFANDLLGSVVATSPRGSGAWLGHGLLPLAGILFAGILSHRLSSNPNPNPNSDATDPAP